MNDRLVLCMTEAGSFRVMTQPWQEAVKTAAALLVFSEVALIQGLGWDAQQVRGDVWELLVAEGNKLIAELQKAGR